MTRKIILATTLLAFATPAFADFYIVRSQGAKECTVVREKPTVSTITVVGNHVYKTEEEARGALKTVCVD